MAQAEHARCLGAWPSAESLASQALRLAQGTETSNTTAAWTQRLQTFRAQAIEEKALDKKFAN